MILSALATLLPSIPVFAVWMVGIALALARIKTRRRSSSLLAAGLFGLLAQRLIVSPMYALAPALAQQYGWSMSTMGLFFSGFAIVESLFAAVWYGLIIAAALLPEPEGGHP